MIQIEGQATSQGGASPESQYFLLYPAIHQGRRPLAFPCDAKGRVNLDALSEKARLNYFLARMTVGRDYLCPLLDSCREDPAHHDHLIF